MAKKKAKSRRKFNLLKLTKRDIKLIMYAMAMISSAISYYDGWPERLFQQAKEEVLNTSADLGLKLENIYIAGHRRYPTHELLEQLKLQYGMPILAISLTEVKSQLESLSWIATAEVDRILPATLHIRIKERIPIAVWQSNKKLALLDQYGDVINTTEIWRYSDLPIVVGGEARFHFQALYEALAPFPTLWKDFKIATRVGERRWNLKFKEGVEVKLPEQGFENAIKLLAELADQGKLFDNNIAYVDLRIGSRMYTKYRSLANND